MERRELIKNLTMLPLAGTFLPLESVISPAEGPLKPGPNIYQSIGIEPVINCVGTYTIIGGSLERPAVVEAMHSASGAFVQYDELAFGVGRRLAEITGAEWGMVSAGCAAGMKHVTSACVAGGNPEKLVRIPDLSGFDKTEVIIPRSSRNAYDHAIRNIGVKIITVNNLYELGKAICPRTAMIYVMTGDDTEPGQEFAVDKIAALATPYNVPLLVDAAAEDLTVPNVHLQRGASVVAYSGGKALCGPQCAGLLLGRKDILMSAWQASSPHHCAGRDNKVGKEEMLGMLAAIEDWVTRDHVEKMRIWHTYLDTISKKIGTISGIKTTIREPEGLNNRSPVLSVSWDPDQFNFTGPDISEELATTKPRIAVHSGFNEREGTTSINICAGQMQPGNDKIVADRVYELLTRKRPKPSPMSAPGGDLTGRWTVSIEYYFSRTQHTFILEQDGNWLQGSHKTDFSMREISGSIDGNNVKLFSSERMIADNVPFTFSGTLSDDTMSGEIYLGEYIRANFTAKKSSYKGSRRQIRFPKGQPLAT